MSPGIYAVVRHGSLRRLALTFQTKALALSSTHLDPGFHGLHERTKCVIFLGTPHRGSGFGGLAAILGDITKLAFQDPNTKLLSGLDQGSEVLGRIHTSFMKLLAKPDFRVHCFQEDRGVTWIKATQIVDYESSRTGSPHELVETLAGDHMSIVSYTGPTDPNYKKVSDTLSWYISKMLTSGDTVKNGS